MRVGCIGDGMIGKADFSKCLKYRYYLERDWSRTMGKNGGKALWILMNPSTADEKENDATTTICIKRSMEMGCTSLVTINLLPFISTDPSGLDGKKTADLLGDQEKKLSQLCINNFDLIVCAWGGGVTKHAKPAFQEGLELIKQKFASFDKSKIFCYGKTQSENQPRHPSRLSNDRELGKFCLECHSI